MATKKISAMSDASALDGSELMEAVQGGSNKKVTPNQIKTFIGATGWGGVWNFAANGGDFPTAATDGIFYVADDDHGTFGDPDYVPEGTWFVSISAGSAFADFSFKQ